MELWRGHEGEVVAAVVNHGGDDDNPQPQPQHGHMCAHQQRASHRRHQVSQHVFYGVGVDSYNPYWRRPFMVQLVDLLVQSRVVQQSTQKEWG